MSKTNLQGFNQEANAKYDSRRQKVLDFVLRQVSTPEEFELFLATRHQYCPSNVMDASVCKKGINGPRGKYSFEYPHFGSCYACITLDGIEGRVPGNVIRKFKKIRKNNPTY